MSDNEEFDFDDDEDFQDEIFSDTDESGEEEEINSDEDTEDEEDEEDYTIKGRKLKNRITMPVLSPYEKSVIIMRRAKQIDSGDKSTLSKEELPPSRSSVDIAMEEFKLNKLPPFKIIRRLGGGYEEWSLEEMKFIDGKRV